MLPCKYDYNKCLITLTLITLSYYRCIILSVSIYKNILNSGFFCFCVCILIPFSALWFSLLAFKVSIYWRNKREKKEKVDFIHLLIQRGPQDMTYNRDTVCPIFVVQSLWELVTSDEIYWCNTVCIRHLNKQSLAMVVWF